jgi:hypothetical protein
VAIVNRPLQPAGGVCTFFAIVLWRHVDHHRQAATALLFDVIIRGVMQDMTMNEPLARLARRPDHIVPFARSHVHRVFFNLRGFWNWIAIRFNDLELDFRKGDYAPAVGL